MLNLIDIRLLFYKCRNSIKKIKQKSNLQKWEKNGRNGPPPHLFKQNKLKNYAKKYNLKIFVETGTYYGDMVEAMQNDFELIYSIELSKKLFKKAKVRFNNNNKIKLVEGDSSIELKNVVKNINNAALFWLDGHYSGGLTEKSDKDTPIMEELKQIFDTEDLGHVILIDDARCFDKDPNYPKLKEIEGFIKSKRPNVMINIQDDIIIIEPMSIGS
jgi:hypothetical protein